MKRLQAGNEILEAARIIRAEDTIIGFEENGTLLFQIGGINDDSQVTLLDGAEFDVPEAVKIEKFDAFSKALAGGSDTEKLAKVINHALKIMAKQLPDESALEVAPLFPAWETSVKYKVGDLVTYGVNQDGEPQLYRVLQTHTSQADWTPDVSASLFKAIGFADDGTPLWVQPLGAHDAYAKNDEVMHNGQVWKSDVDGNTWEPGVYGWTLK